MGFIKTSDGDNENKIMKIVQGTKDGPEVLEVVHQEPKSENKIETNQEKSKTTLH